MRLILATSIGLLLTGIIVFQLSNLSVDDGESIIDKTTLVQAGSSEDGLEEGLGEGADVTWVSEESSLLGDNGYSPTGTLIIRGATNTSIYIEAQITARIGPLSKKIYQDAFFLAPLSEKSIQISIGDARNLHEKQFEYATKLLGYVSATREETGRRYTQLVPTRFLVYRDDLKNYELINDDTLRSKYPYGFTTTEGQDVVRRILEETPKGEFIEEIGPGIVLEEAR
ncbi:MAG: hypothetical protein IT350_15360 [Deltaproteobacteria bacterium]|nr:hypothetical protein [Deltaproteobacteria bacterium]